MIPAGTVTYTLGTGPVTGTGYSWTEAELDLALSGPVAEVVFDDAGTPDLSAFLSGLADTEFAQDNVRQALSRTKEPEDWRVGEALAESYLTHHRGCSFPWPDARDERKAGSSLPGADLVGFQKAGADVRFAFGEVKTSSEAKYPPGAMHGRTGLKQQLEDLSDDRAIRDKLVIYLCYRAILGPPWLEEYKRAATRYFSNSADVRVFGVLVRDVAPHEDDCRVRVTKLATGCPTNMVIELFAIYLPAGAIASLSQKVLQFRVGGAS
jgi:hypothetical protein